METTPTNFNVKDMTENSKNVNATLKVLEIGEVKDIKSQYGDKRVCESFTAGHPFMYEREPALGQGLDKGVSPTTMRKDPRDALRGNRVGRSHSEQSAGRHVRHSWGESTESGLPASRAG